MSTQRRENRWRRISYTRRSEASGLFFSRPVARCAYSIASDGTAPVRLATNSLQLGIRIVQLVSRVICHRPPLFAAGSDTASGTPVIHGSPHPHIPSLSGHARLLPALSRVPAG